MKYDKFTISFAQGAAGRFLTFILNGLILDNHTEIVLSENNHAHDNHLYTGISIPTPNQHDIFEMLNFETKTEIKHTKILSTHVFPKIEMINERFSDIGIVIISIDEESISEIFMNHILKNEGKEFNFRSITKELEFMKIYQKFVDLEIPKLDNILVINYLDLFVQTEHSYLGLELLENFTGLKANNTVFLNYQRYVDQRNTLISKYANILSRLKYVY